MSKLAPIGKRRMKASVLRKRTLEAAWGPKDTWVCVIRERPFSRQIMGPCYGEVNAHELLKRSRAGQTDANLLNVERMVPLCNFHNGWVEDHPIQAHDLGLALHAWEVE